MAAKKAGTPTRMGSTPRKRAPGSLAAALAEAAWIEADAALAEALVCADEFASNPAAPSRRTALALLRQALARAARKRGFTRLGEVGARESYDPRLHELTGAFARLPKTVDIVASGVARGAQILVKARVAAVKRVKRR